MRSVEAETAPLGFRIWMFLTVALSCSLGCGSRTSVSSASDASRVPVPDGAAGSSGSSGADGSGKGGSVASGDAGDGDSGCSIAGNTSCESGLACERYRMPTCLDPTWAQWPMPNAQIEVAAGAGNLQSYTDNGDGTVTDNVTKLVWQQLTPSGDYTQAAALAYCTELHLGGYADWRLPAVIELVSIVDTGTYNPSIDSTMFPGTPAVGFYWSSTPYTGLPDNMWGVYFNNGYMDYNDESLVYSVRCVR